MVHRWLGIGMCLLFTMWFASGAVMLFIPFPALSDADRYRAMSPVDVSALQVAPSAATGSHTTEDAPLEHMELIEGLRGPVYVLWYEGLPAVALSARSGTRLPPISPTDAASIARNFGGTAINRVNGPYEYDQWTVHQHFNAYRPLYRVDLQDPAGTHLYISARTGEVVQRTTHLQRFANYAGSIVHWIYPTILRRYPNAWSNTVWVISAIGIGMAISGIALGLIRTRASLGSARGRKLTPFRKLFRLHHLTGLGIGLFLVTWIFSGWLSVDHGLIFPTGNPSDGEVGAYRGISLARAARTVSVTTLNRLQGYSYLRLSAVGGKLIISARQSDTGQAMTWAADGTPMRGVPFGLIKEGLRAAWPGTAPIIDPIALDDQYAHLVYDPLPQTAVRAKLGDSAATWVHIDDTDGRIIELMDWRRRIYRWLFNGLHTFDFAGLAEHDVLRKALILPLLAGGLFLSMTGMILGLKRLRRTLS